MFHVQMNPQKNYRKAAVERMKVVYRLVDR
jgi:hypothetical protein